MSVAGGALGGRKGLSRPPVALIVTLFVASVSTAAGADAPPQVPAISDPTVLLAAFEAAYQPADFLLLPHLDADAALRHAQLRTSPSFGVSERFEWEYAGSAALQVAVDVAVPLYSARGPLEAAAAETAVVVTALELERGHAGARGSFLGDLFALSLLGETRGSLAAALTAVADAHPDLARAATTASRDASPDQQPVIELYAGSLDLLEHLQVHLGQLRSRIASATKLPEAQLAPPPVAALEAVLADALPDECLVTGPLEVAAHLRYQQSLAAANLQAAPDVRVMLSLSASYSTAAGAAGRASLGAEVRLPPDWPFAARGGLDVASDGLSQVLEIRWPPSPAPAASRRSPEDDLAATLSAIGDELELAQAAVERARRERDLAEARVWWFARGAFALPEDADLGQLAELTGSDWLDPVARLRLAELLARLAFADLQSAMARIDRLTKCGAGP